MGKSTLVQQVTESLAVPVRQASADEPALLRRMFELACRYSGQVLSYTKMLGQLQDAGRRLIAIEVKSGRAPQAHPGTAAFVEAFNRHRTLLVGSDGITLKDFLSQAASHWVKS